MQLALFSLVVGVVSGFAGGGRFANVGWRRIRMTWLPVAWAGGVVLSGFLNGEAAFALGLAGLGCLTLFAVVNTKVLSCMWLVAAGLCLNFVVTADNHGMPYSPVSLATAGVRPQSYNDIPKSTALSHPERPGDQLLFLSDVIPISPLRTVVSFGDLLVAFGLGCVTAAAMWDRRPRRFRAPRHLKKNDGRGSGRTAPGLGRFRRTVDATPSDASAVSPASAVAAVADLSVVDGPADSPVSDGWGVPSPMSVVDAAVPDPSDVSTGPGPSTTPEPANPGFSARLLLLEATGDPSVLIDLTDDASTGLAEVTASHVVGVALRRYALDDRLVAQAAAAEDATP